MKKMNYFFHAIALFIAICISGYSWHLLNGNQLTSFALGVAMSAHALIKWMGLQGSMNQVHILFFCFQASALYFSMAAFIVSFGRRDDENKFSQRLLIYASPALLLLMISRLWFILHLLLSTITEMFAIKYRNKVNRALKYIYPVYTAFIIVLYLWLLLVGPKVGISQFP